MKRWYLLTTDGLIFEQPPTFQKQPSTLSGDRARLEELQNAVGGLIEHVQLDGRTEMWCNEEGKLYDLPRNVLATEIWNVFYGDTDVIVGNILIEFTGQPSKLGAVALKLIQNFRAEIDHA